MQLGQLACAGRAPALPLRLELAGEVLELQPSSAEFIEKASGIKARHVMSKAPILDPDTMCPRLPERGNDELSVMAEIGVAAARQALLDAKARISDVANSEEQAGFGTTVTLDAPSMPTIDIKVHHLASGWKGQAYEHNANSICVVLQGSGTSEIGGARFEWALGDVMAMPMGLRLQHSAREDAIVVELSDEKLMRHCQFYRRRAVN